MNNKGQSTVLGVAVAFVALFLTGGIVASLSLPAFPGRFYLGGLLVGIFGTGAGALIIKFVASNGYVRL